MWEELEKWIYNELPNDGEWWDESNALPFVEVAGLIYGDEIEIEIIKESLQKLYSAMSDEFGS